MGPYRRSIAATGTALRPQSTSELVTTRYAGANGGVTQLKESGAGARLAVATPATPITDAMTTTPTRLRRAIRTIQLAATSQRPMTGSR